MVLQVLGLSLDWDGLGDTCIVGVIVSGLWSMSAWTTALHLRIERWLSSRRYLHRLVHVLALNHARAVQRWNLFESLLGRLILVLGPI